MHRRRLLTGFAAAMACAFLPSMAAPRCAAWAPLLAHLTSAQRDQLADPALRVQLLWQQVERDTEGRVHLRTPLRWQVDHHRWFSPASTVKLPMALLATEALCRYPEGLAQRLRLDAPPISGEWGEREPLAEPFRDTLWRLLVRSDNAPYNRLHEFLGPDAVHARLAALGAPHARLLSRLGSPDPLANRQTGSGAVEALRGEAWQPVTIWPGRQAAARTFPHGDARFGEAWRQDDGSVVPGPRDMRYANFLALEDSLALLSRLLFPEAFPEAQRWRLAEAARRELIAITARYPREMPPALQDAAMVLDDGYAKFFVVGDGSPPPPGFRSFGKTGEAYGFHSEIALLTDTDGEVETLLAAVVYANADGVLNDDRYDYDTVSRPLLAALGRAALAAERERRRRHRPGAALWSRQLGMA